jgi:hypothetical protein
MSNDTTPFRTAAERPAVLIAYEREREQRDAVMRERWGDRWFLDAPPEILDPQAEADGLALARAFSSLTPAEIQAEEQRCAAVANDLRRQADAETDPAAARSLCIQADMCIDGWHSLKASANATISYQLTILHNARSRAETEAITLAEAALANCSYLGGFPGYAQPARRCALLGHVGTHGNLHWRTSRDTVVAAVKWPEIQSITVTSSDRGQERVTATRFAAFGLLALGTKKQRREAQLLIKTASGEGSFTVRRLPPAALQAQLAPLIACVGSKTSDEYTAQIANVKADLAVR